MGGGRRMKKQGMPEPFENFGAAKKNKAATGSNGAPRGKKRTANGDVKTLNGKHEAQNNVSKSQVQNGTRKQPRGSTSAQISKVQSRVLSAPEDGASDDEGLLDDDPDLGSDAVFQDGAEMELRDKDGIGADGFMGSGEDSDVYDSGEDHRKDDMWSEDESDAEEKLTAANMDALSRKLDVKQAKDEAEAQAELEEAAIQTNIDGDRPDVLADVSDDEDDPAPRLRLAPDLQLLRTKITDTVRILDDFGKLHEEGRSRAEYTQQLEKDICAYYGYSPFLAAKFLSLFSPREAFAFFEANETPRPVVLRTNTLKTSRRDLAQALIARGVTLEPVGKWSKVGLQVFESQVPLGATPEYLAGHYMLQAASSFLPVMALAPQEGERVLDMASAPGGKTTYMSAIMKNTGVIFANDSNKARAKSLIGNVHRLGAKNTIICNYDAREFPKVIGGFDRVLLDAPCSGTGVIAKDPSVKTNKTERDFLALPHLQKQILLSAIDSVDHASKTGGYIVYSTCSVTVEENEMVVQYALRKRPNVKIVETGLVFGANGFTNWMGKKFDDRMVHARRYYPHMFNVDGFFVCKLKKTGPSPRTAEAARQAGGKVPKENGTVVDDVVAEDREPIRDEDEEMVDDFGGFDEEEDSAYIERAEKRSMRRKGLNPKARKSKAAV